MRSTLAFCFSLLFLGALQGCTESAPALAQNTIPCNSPQRLAELPAAIVEASGIVPSRAHPGVYWIHNDDGRELFAVDRAGRLRGRVRISHEVRDWEDIAIAACDAGNCLYLADIGDNQHERAHISIYRVPEPALDAETAAAPTRIDLRYPDGPQDAEALFVLPGERVHIVSKGRHGPIALYRLARFESGTLEPVRQLTSGVVQFPDMVTGAALSPDAAWAAIRTYSYVDIYPVAADTLAHRATVRVPLAALREPQGEGVGFDAGGELVFVSERNAQSRSAPLSAVRCTFD